MAQKSLQGQTTVLATSNKAKLFKLPFFLLCMNSSLILMIVNQILVKRKKRGLQRWQFKIYISQTNTYNFFVLFRLALQYSCTHKLFLECPYICRSRVQFVPLFLCHEEGQKSIKRQMTDKWHLQYLLSSTLGEKAVLQANNKGNRLFTTISLAGTSYSCVRQPDAGHNRL